VVPSWIGVLTDDLGGNVGCGSEVEAKLNKVPWLKPKEFLEMVNHSSWLAKREERGRRLLSL